MTERQAKPPLRFLLVRHGRSEANARLHADQFGLSESEIPDISSIPDESIQLMPVGFEQADACGVFLQKYLAENPIEGGIALHCSSYMRARQTAQRIYDNIIDITGSNLRSRDSDFLIEQHYGFADGLTDAERRERFPDYTAREDLHWENGSRQFSPMHGGEMRVGVAHRVATHLDSVFQEHQDHGVNTFIIVSHGVTMRQIAKHLLRMTREQSDIEKNPFNCDVRLLQRYDDGNRRFGDFGHIWREGRAEPPQLKTYPVLGDLFARGEYRNYAQRQPKTDVPKL